MASANKTPNYDLPQWVATDKPERTDFNQAMSDIDTNLNLVQSMLTQTTAGRFVLPGGLKICWGKSTVDYANANVAQGAIAFPFTFSAVPIVVIAGQTTTGNSAAEIPINHKVRNITTSGFVGVVHSPSEFFTSGNIGNYPLNWIAIGY